MDDLTRYNPEGSTLRKAQLRMVEIMVEIDKVCRKNNIKYWIDYGSLLGAVRHKGFIPWDDDIDICVLTEDYPKIREALIRELPKQFVFQDNTTDKHVYIRPGRVRDTHSVSGYPMFATLKEQGLWVDVFQTDRVLSKGSKQFIDYFYRRTYREIHHYGDVAYQSPVKRIVWKICAYMAHPFTAAAMHFYTFLSNRFGKGLMAHFAYNYSGMWADEKNIFPLTEVEFEGHKFLAPHDCDAHLRMRYGDYMKLPPEDKRKTALNLEKVKIW